MFSSIEIRPLKIRCDAPSYEVVRASEQIGMRSPEDVPWRRRVVARAERRSLGYRLWRLLFAFGMPEVEEKCGCGSTLPERRGVQLRSRRGKEVRFALTQCGRCRTILWDRERINS